MVSASLNASSKMTSKLYTVGQIAKKHKANLKSVYMWTRSIQKIMGISGRSHGIVLISDDPHHRYGIPEELADMYPDVPHKHMILSTLQGYKVSELKEGIHL